MAAVGNYSVRVAKSPFPPAAAEITIPESTEDSK
jgi:hypothetical protein